MSKTEKAIKQTKESGLHDLQHFLRLANSQAKYLLSQLDGNIRPGDQLSQSSRRLRILHELIKEQISDENPRVAIGSTR
jgi:hypothetical protein